MSDIIIPQGLDPKQLDAMMRGGKGPQMVPIQIPREVQDAQKKYVETGLDIYAELAAIQDENVIAKALMWMMKGQLPFEMVKKIDEEVEKSSEET